MPFYEVSIWKENHISSVILTRHIQGLGDGKILNVQSTIHYTLKENLLLDILKKYANQC